MHSRTLKKILIITNLNMQAISARRVAEIKKDVSINGAAAC